MTRDECIGGLTLMANRSEMGYTERFEAMAADFYEATGMLAPGKSYPAEMPYPGDEKRDSAWYSYTEAYRKQCIAALRQAAEELSHGNG
jgi:hypothetical protein